MANNSKLKVSPAELRMQAKVLIGSYTTHQSIQKKILNLVSEIALDWQGEAADAYIKQLLEMVPLFQAFDENTNQMAKIIEQTADRFEDKDKELGRRFEALD